MGTGGVKLFLGFPGRLPTAIAAWFVAIGSLAANLHPCSALRMYHVFKY